MSTNIRVIGALAPTRPPVQAAAPAIVIAEAEDAVLADVLDRPSSTPPKPPQRGLKAVTAEAGRQLREWQMAMAHAVVHFLFPQYGGEIDKFLDRAIAQKAAMEQDLHVVAARRERAELEAERAAFEREKRAQGLEAAMMARKVIQLQDDLEAAERRVEKALAAGRSEAEDRLRKQVRTLKSTIFKLSQGEEIEAGDLPGFANRQQLVKLLNTAKAATVKADEAAAADDDKTFGELSFPSTVTVKGGFVLKAGVVYQITGKKVNHEGVTNAYFVEIGGNRNVYVPTTTIGSNNGTARATADCPIRA